MWKEISSVDMIWEPLRKQMYYPNDSNLCVQYFWGENVTNTTFKLKNKTLQIKYITTVTEVETE